MPAAQHTLTDAGERIERSPLYDFEVKVLDEPGRFEGYASTFENVDRQGDVMLPGAFTATLRENKGRVPILYGHLQSRVVGFGVDATEDSKGLKVVGEFTLDSDDGRNVYAIAKHAAKLGSKLGLSIGYGIRKDGAAWNEATGVRELKAVNLYEWSIAAVPANPRATIGRVKGAARGMSASELRAVLTSAGFSQAEAREFLFIAKGLPCAGDEADDNGALPRAESQTAVDFGAVLTELRRAQLAIASTPILR